jgi:hypothetical protein
LFSREFLIPADIEYFEVCTGAAESITYHLNATNFTYCELDKDDDGVTPCRPLDGAVFGEERCGNGS